MTVQVIQQAQCFECGKMFPFADLSKTRNGPAPPEGRPFPFPGIGRVGTIIVPDEFKEPNHCPRCFAMLFGPVAKEFSHGTAEVNFLNRALAG